MLCHPLYKGVLVGFVVRDTVWKRFLFNSYSLTQKDDFARNRPLL
ncbi:hypothetical protein RU88_GL001956 [Lactococcus raffinolactis]|nr:hypothetical protein RU88_GL001956 [Lactococcus raffinolactis]